REKTAFGTGRCRLVFEYLPVDAYIAVSGYYERLMRRFGAQPIHRVYLGVDTVKFRSAPRAEARLRHNLSDEDFVVTCLARLKPRKGILDLVQATARAVDRLPSLRLIIAGTTSSASSAYAQEIQDEVRKLRLTGTVRLVNDLRHDGVPSLLQASDVAVQPSYTEGLGLAVIEAMSCGIPVIATRATGLSEIVKDGENGLQVEVGNRGELARAITRMATDPRLRARLSSSGRKAVEKWFSLDRMVNETSSIYQTVIDDAKQYKRVRVPRNGGLLE
ncbi:glycosyltransferase family 4 protein, partial [Actinoplanes sp. NPDC051633]|uniref:glycosyltransferase family 4 protein n=1 Tax=Actinoplanes sp. NPDC051633 TaxID=3155670 RepID=UPI003446E5BD